MRIFFLSAWRAGWRSRSVQGVLVFGGLLVGMAYLSAAFAPHAPKTVALDVGLSGIRFSLVLLALFWVQELVGREIDRRTVLFALTYPVGRGQFVIGRYAGIVGLLLLSALLLGMALWLSVFFAGGAYEQAFSVALGLPYWGTVFGLAVDAIVVAAFALLMATLSTVPMLPLALGLAFAVAGKSLGAVIEYLSRGADGDAELMKISPVIDAIQWVLPDLSRLDWRVWPMYSNAPTTEAVIWGLVLAGSYIGILVSLSVLAFSRREFQ